MTTRFEQLLSELELPFIKLSDSKLADRVDKSINAIDAVIDAGWNLPV